MENLKRIVDNQYNIGYTVDGFCGWRIVIVNNIVDTVDGELVY